jgi:cell division protein FtsB
MRWIRMGSSLAVVVAMVAMLIIGITQASRLAAVDAQIKEKTKHVAELAEQERTLTTNIKQLQRTVAAFAIEAGSAKSKEIVAAVNADPGAPTPTPSGLPAPELKP